ncbi:MAG: hypothetical protein MI919_18305, partial [Holophagales bacterium]|nr:hypothetical protein [Holophagales bacterium]
MSRLLDRSAASVPRFFGFLGILAALSVPAWPARAQNLPVRTYTEDDGLPSSEVYGVRQAPDGRIWVATRSGLAVYDGATWTPIAMPEGAPYTGLRALDLDAAGRPWAVPLFGQLIVQSWDGERWHSRHARGFASWRFGEPLTFAVAGSPEEPWAAVGTPANPLLTVAGG